MSAEQMSSPTTTCGCCAGIAPSTPLPTANRPGLAALSYRVGTHATFFETMLARLSTHYLEQPAEIESEPGQPARPLHSLTTRQPDDPAIALLDSWATVADVLTFYNERLVNEGYLRTATERRSVLELAQLVGYTPRPGVAATAYLAYTLDENNQETITIAPGTRVQSLPGSDELPQTFETAEVLQARAAWNNLKPCLTRPQKITLNGAQEVRQIYLAGTTTNLKPNEPLLLVFGQTSGERVLRRVLEVQAQAEQERTQVTLQPVPFLIIAGVALLRLAISTLNHELAKAELEEGHQINDLVDLGETLQVVLENLLLGNYPPLQEDNFTHELVYGLIAEEELPFRATMAIRRSAVTASSEGEESPWENPIFINTVVEVLEAATALLPTLHRDLICLLKQILRAMRPGNLSEQRQLARLFTSESRPLTRLLRQLIQLRAWLTEELADVDQQKLQQGVLAFWRQFSQLFLDKELNESLQNLLTDFLAVLPADNGTPTHVDQFAEERKFMLEVQAWLKTLQTTASVACEPTTVTTTLSQLVAPLLKPASISPANSARLPRSTALAFTKEADTVPQLLIGMQPGLRSALYVAWANANVNPAPQVLESVHALRLLVSPFGYNAPVKMALKRNLDEDTQRDLPFISQPDGDWSPSEPSDEAKNILYLDNAYEAILPGSYLVLQSPNHGRMAARVESILTRPRTAYNISTKTSQLTLSRSWWNGAQDRMSRLRQTAVYAQSEALPLALAPCLGDISGQTIELNELYDGLNSGRWLVVSGERTDIPGTSGVQASELVMLNAIEQTFDPELPGDKVHSQITLAEKLTYSYKRESVILYGNVVRATHGETRNEVLGNGDGSKALQSFTLKQPPLTFVPAINPSGVESTLHVRVNDVEWHESPNLAALGPASRNFITQTDDEGKTTVIFGNGLRGVRLPTGQANIKAVYRNGIGKPGNVKAKQISLLMDRPLGVREVINPLRASGGADKESRDQARRNAPLAVSALDRLVSVQDYADFARTFAGIGKAQAVRLPDGQRQVVHVTIAGADDVPIDPSSDLYRALRNALYAFGDPYQPIQLAVRDLLLMLISANVRLTPDYLWEAVVPQIRTALLTAFGFDRREFGQDVLLSEVLTVIQGVAGVAYVDVDALDVVTDTLLQEFLAQPDPPLDLLTFLTQKRNQPGQGLTGTAGNPPPARLMVKQARVDATTRRVQPAQLAYLSPDVSETLILNLIKE